MLWSTSGWVVDDKRVERIWRQEGLMVPSRRPKAVKSRITADTYRHWGGRAPRKHEACVTVTTLDATKNWLRTLWRQTRRSIGTTCRNLKISFGIMQQ